MKNIKIIITKETKEKELAGKLKNEIGERKHTEKMKEIELEQKGMQHNIDTLKAISKNNLIELLMKPFTKTKKLTKSFFRKAINIGHNVFWILLLAFLMGCGDNNPVQNKLDILVGHLDSMRVENSNNNGDSNNAMIHLCRLVKDVKVSFNIESNADTNNKPMILIKFGITEYRTSSLPENLQFILNNIDLDSDVFITLSVTSSNSNLVFIKLSNINIQAN